MELTTLQPPPITMFTIEPGDNCTHVYYCEKLLATCLSPEAAEVTAKLWERALRDGQLNDVNILRKGFHNGN